jgi:cytoskeletal protein CcmA (bactofilin family)
MITSERGFGMKIQRFLTSLLVSIAVLFFVQPIQAVTFRSGETTSFSSTETSNGSLFISGSQVTIAGMVNGDVFCAGQEVDITGTVNGDVLCAGQNVRISGPVTGDVRVAGQLVSIRNTVASNASLLGQTIYIEPQASVSGEIGFLSQTFRLEGKAGASVYGGGETAIISGPVEQDVTLFADSVQVSSTGVIKGNLTYTSEKTAQLAEGSRIAGTVSQQKPPVEQTSRTSPSMQQFTNVERGFRGATFLVTSLLFGGLLLFFAKKQTEFILSWMKKETGAALLRGLLVFIGIPVALVFLFITIIGIPVALIGIGIFALLYFLARSLSAILLGELLLTRLWEKKKDFKPLSLILGVIVLWSISFIPVLGGIVSLLSVLYGLGGMTVLLSKKQQTKK